MLEVLYAVLKPILDILNAIIECVQWILDHTIGWLMDIIDTVVGWFTLQVTKQIHLIALSIIKLRITSLLIQVLAL